nr:NAD(P)/FAD-dependent oxidoreductase [uncultured Duganella sp.]
MQRAEQPDVWDAVIIGAGIGGLTTAALLAQAGARVLVCEQHHQPGGYCHSWERIVRHQGQRHRFRFDSAVHDISGVLAGGPVAAVLARLGLERALDWRPVRHTYLVPAGRFVVDAGGHAYVGALRRAWPLEADGIQHFFALLRRCYDELYTYAAQTGGLPRPPRDALEMGRFLRLCPTLSPLMDQPFVQVRDGLLQAPALRQLVAILAFYVSDAAERLSFANMLPLYGYYFRGGCYPGGGSQQLADTLVRKIAVHGGQVRLRAPVASITVQRQRATGVVLRDGSALQAGMVICNADPLQAFGPLLEGMQADLARQRAAFQPSNSAFMVYLALHHAPALAATTILLQGSEGVMLSCPPLPEQRAPPGYTTLTLTGLVDAAEAASWRRRDGTYAARKRAAGDRLLALAARQFPALAQHIVYREDGSPATLHRYTWCSGNAAYGVTPASRWPRHDTPLRQLYLVGASTGLGPGIEAVMIGAASLAEQLGATTPVCQQ